MSAIAVLHVPRTPPSFNAIGYHSHWSRGHHHKALWQTEIEYLLMERRLPHQLRRVEAKATIYFKQRRRRDEGNFRVIVEKALGDALVNGRWLPDDTPDHYSFGRLQLVAPSDLAPMTMFELTYIEGGTP
jgi:hypothetical protein